jgi:cyclophilin family peptidyl-prolyl cis-trans isomerase
MTRNASLWLVTGLFAALLAGCPLNSNDNPILAGSTQPEPTSFDVTATSPQPAATSQTVALVASLSGTGDLSGLRYRWRQTYGRGVTLQSADTAVATFVVPSVETDTTIGFRVDVTSPRGVVRSAEVSARLFADPDFGLDPTPDDGGDKAPFPQVRIKTSMGDIVVELNREKAPLSVSNFLRYTDDGFYDGTIFHRVVEEFVVQGGGFLPDLTQKRTRDPIRNEDSNGLKNVLGSIAMARTNDPDSATAQFYFNLKDNTDLDARPADSFRGYAVFGRVVEGLDVVQEIGMVTTSTQMGFMNVPVDDVIIESVKRVE